MHWFSFCLGALYLVTSLHYNHKSDRNGAFWVVSKAWTSAVCWQCWDSTMSLHTRVCLFHNGKRFCMLHFISFDCLLLKISTANLVAGGIEGDWSSLSSKFYWTYHLTSLLGWSISKSGVAWASKLPVQLGNRGVRVWGTTEMKQPAQIKQEVSSWSSSLGIFCQLWAGGAKLAWCKGC